MGIFHLKVILKFKQNFFKVDHAFVRYNNYCNGQGHDLFYVEELQNRFSYGKGEIFIMDGKNVKNIRKRKRRRQRQIARFIAVCSFFCIIAAAFGGGLFVGYSMHESRAQEISEKDVLADSNLMSDMQDNVAYDDSQDNGMQLYETDNGDMWTNDTEESGGQADISDTQWNLILVNRWNPIPDNYKVDLVEVEGGEYVDARIYEPLMEMLTDAKEANWDQLPLVVSGYRTAEQQQQLYNEKIGEYSRQGYSEDEAEEMAQQWVSVPGYSEHQLGFAVDINGATYDVYLWLQENSYKYGFIFRYPGYKTEKTGVAEEVWHYRYVGIEAAAEIHEQGICLEEYLERRNQ